MGTRYSIPPPGMLPSATIATAAAGAVSTRMPFCCVATTAASSVAGLSRHVCAFFDVAAEPHLTPSQ